MLSHPEDGAVFLIYVLQKRHLQNGRLSAVQRIYLITIQSQGFVLTSIIITLALSAILKSIFYIHSKWLLMASTMQWISIHETVLLACKTFSAKINFEIFN